MSKLSFYCARGGREAQLFAGRRSRKRILTASGPGLSFSAVLLPVLLRLHSHGTGDGTMPHSPQDTKGGSPQREAGGVPLGSREAVWHVP